MCWLVGWFVCLFGWLVGCLRVPLSFEGATFICASFLKHVHFDVKRFVIESHLVEWLLQLKVYNS